MAFLFGKKKAPADLIKSCEKAVEEMKGVDMKQDEKAAKKVGSFVWIPL